MTNSSQRGAIGFAEKLLELLDEGRYTATYKYAVLLGLMDLCLEQTERSGAAPQIITTRQLAEKIIELFWRHTVPFVGSSPARLLKQNLGGQAEIVALILLFRERHAAEPSVPRWEARRSAPDAYERLTRDVEWKLIEMPLPRLQTMGHSDQRFIYELSWDRRVAKSSVRQYQDGQRNSFDNRLVLKPYVGEYFLQLNGLLRPLIQRRWAAMVAQLNRLVDSELESFLFGADRVRTARVRAGLWESQGRRCFYCDARVATPVLGEVDHFLPWSRYPDDSLDNFVVADKRCNALKKGSLAAHDHVKRWSGRFVRGSASYVQLSELSERTRWDRRPDRTLNVARAIYLRLPPDARLWLKGNDFVPPDADAIGLTLRDA